MSIIVPFNDSDNTHVFTNCHAFQRHVARIVNSETSLVRLSSYNVGIGENWEVDEFMEAVCAAKEVHLMVGYNPNHIKNTEITARLANFHKRHKHLEVRRLERLHAKIVSVHEKTTMTWTGSLNLISPNLYDLMVKLDPTQSREVCDWFDRLWLHAPVLFNR